MIVSIYPYILLNGQGQEAIGFYKEALDAEVVQVLTFGDMPPHPDQPPMSDEVKKRILNAHLKVGGSDLMLSDTFPGQPYRQGSQVSIALIVSSVEKAREVVDKLQVGGEVNFPLQETFWSPAYGQVTDRFGVQWQVSTQQDQA
ncbi:MAG TPA: VOC family protein [Bacillota bacterium]